MESLDELSAQARACRICRDEPWGAALPDPRPVFRVSSTARLCVASQAPGTRVHETGIPFNDRSGDRLRDWMGVAREEFYDVSRVAIVPMGFCYPGQDGKGGDLPPRAECAPRWRALFFAQLKRLELVLCIGQYALAWHLGQAPRGSLTETVRDWRAILDRREDVRVLPLPHPSWRNNAWLKQNPWFEAELVPVLRGEVRRILANG